MDDGSSALESRSLTAPDARGVGQVRYAWLAHERTNNIGDQIQSIASKRFLPRVDQIIIRDRIGEFGADEPTRIICNGWFTHNPERFAIGKNIEPLFIAFHVTPHPGMGGLSLSFADLLRKIPESREALIRFGPVGARDLVTWKLLRELGVNCYFSGCLTLTLQADPTEVRSETIVLTDVAPPVAERVRASTDRDILTIQHSALSTPGEDAALHRAEQLLGIYATSHLVITSRLHVAMPCLAFGTPVILVGDHLNDPRFSGLKELCVHSSVAAFAALPREWFDRPEPNPAQYLTLRKELVEQVTEFMQRDGSLPYAPQVRFDSTARALALNLDAVNRQLEDRVREIEIDAEARLSAAVQSADAEAADLRTALGERDAALQRADVETADLRTALGERDAALQRADVETADLRTALGERDAAIAMLQNELAAVRATSAHQHAAATEVMQANHASALKSVRADLASAQSALTERTEAAATLQAELLSMRDELAAARQVGRSLLAALRAGPALAAPTEQPGRRRQGIFRLIRHWR